MFKTKLDKGRSLGITVLAHKFVKTKLANGRSLGITILTHKFFKTKLIKGFLICKDSTVELYV
tara:strand:+ start:278 stop:466 length:189 start_codon:yes stop_codon:yes gene_type:complete